MNHPWTFPEEVLAILRQTTWDPKAICIFDGVSGGLLWSDEYPPEAMAVCFSSNNWAFRYVLAYRASLIQGEPREEFSAPWDQLVEQCPNWPGLRPERQSPTLRDHLIEAHARFARKFQEVDTKYGDTRREM
ncbi:hypothetical protein C5Y96_11440 [Blastopirellula marina]|uniref:Uncharacterized protein n=1 Tax=Blastopirellula marina TaxID=124 RepID=A0A2S8FMN2_9BACT|nr:MULTISPECIES: hypothetical protein [Pirellulaceae]PQO33449.1 hypothetical protein C5Y96_11440 [Blastopirellula marina]RCS52539.1 hypothetical protein DTL36_11450 [Bremerella cremea]